MSSILANKYRSLQLYTETAEDTYNLKAYVIYANKYLTLEELGQYMGVNASTIEAWREKFGGDHKYVGQG